MKVKICILLTLVILCLSGCSEPEPERTWRDDFTVQCRHIEESQYDDPVDEFGALLDGTFVFEQDEYTITNKTNYVMNDVKLIYYVDTPGYEPFEFEQYIGKMKQGESAVKSVTESWIIIELGITSFPEGYVFDFDDYQLIRIEYEIEE